MYEVDMTKKLEKSTQKLDKHRGLVEILFLTPNE